MKKILALSIIFGSLSVVASEKNTIGSFLMKTHSGKVIAVNKDLNCATIADDQGQPTFKFVLSAGSAARYDALSEKDGGVTISVCGAELTLKPKTGYGRTPTEVAINGEQTLCVKKTFSLKKTCS